jgi:DNA-binding transcriptional MocR family regulator
VAGAYAVLEEAGWLQRRQGSGTTVSGRHNLTLTRPARVPVSEGFAYEALLDGGSQAVDLTIAGFRADAALTAETVENAAGDIARIFRTEVGYLPAGLPELRSAIARWSTERGLPTRPSQVLITSGAQQAITLIAQSLLSPGDTVALESPTYYGAIDAMRARRASLVSLPLDDQGLDPTRGIEANPAPRLLYATATCNNPTGAVLSLPRRRGLARWTERTGGILVEDQALAPLLLDPVQPPALASLTDADTVLTIGSFSKLFWPGLRVGWIRASDAVVNQLSRAKLLADLGTSLISQAIALRLLETWNAVAELRRQQLGERLRLLDGALSQRLPSWHRVDGRGGLFAWIRLPGADGDRLAQVARRHDVAVMPGSVLSVDGRHNSYLRLSLAPELQTLEIGLMRLTDAWDAYNSTRSQIETEVAQPVLV